MGMFGTNYSLEQLYQLPVAQRRQIALDYARSLGIKATRSLVNDLAEVPFTPTEWEKVPLPLKIFFRVGAVAKVLNDIVDQNVTGTLKNAGTFIGQKVSEIWSPSNILSGEQELEAIKKHNLKKPVETEPKQDYKTLFAGDGLKSFANNVTQKNIKSDDIPNVTKFPEKIYANNPIRASKTYQAPRPTLPERRLNKHGRFTGFTNTKPRRTQTLQQSASSRVYGMLLHRPISAEKAVLYESHSSPFFSNLWQVQRGRGKLWAEWAKNNFGKYPATFNLYDTAVVFMTGISSNHTELFFGIDAIIGIAQEFKRQSIGANPKVRCKVPTGTIRKEPPRRREYSKENIKGLSLSGDTGEKLILNAIAKTLGVNDLPATVPEYLVSTSTGDVTIKTLPQLMAYTVKQLDALVGQFPVEMTIKDIDPSKPGNQSKKILIPNIAEGIAEMMGIQFNSLINSETLIQIALKGLIQSGQATIAATVAQDYGAAISEYLGFKLEGVTRELPFVFSPGKNTIEEILKESKQKIASYENGDKKDLQDDLKQLLFAASIIRAVHWKKVNPKGDIKLQLRAEMDKFRDTVDSSASDKDWDNFVRDAEIGFTTATGISDPLNPYGKPFSERPKIKDLDDTSK